MNLRVLLGFWLAASSALIAAACAQSATPASTDPLPTVTACPAALLRGYLMQRAGELVVDPDGDEGGDFSRVLWQPWEYRVETTGREFFVVDLTGEQVAAEGDYVWLGGGEAEGSGVFTVCGPFEVESEPQILFIQNRGGPSYTVKIADVEVKTVECDVYSSITARLGEVPPLPWYLSVVRDRDGKKVFEELVARLPGWLLLFDDPEATSIYVIEPHGPPHPPCPTGEPSPAATH